MPLPANVPYSGIAAISPTVNGMNIMAWLAAAMTLPCRRSTSRSTSRPTPNMKIVSPACASTLTSGMIEAGSTALVTPGATVCSSDGPRISPATISPSTVG
jgi:hypothetical protein